MKNSTTFRGTETSQILKHRDLKILENINNTSLFKLIHVMLDMILDVLYCRFFIQIHLIYQISGRMKVTWNFLIHEAF